MSFGSRWRAAWKALFGAGGSPQSAGGLLAGIFPYGQLPRRGTRELMQAYRHLPWLRTVTQRIAQDVAGVPWRLYRAKRKGTKALVLRAQGPVRRKLLDEAAGDGLLDEIEDHPALDLLGRLNPAMSGLVGRMVTQLYLDLKGEVFWVLERNGAGEPVEAWPVPPHWIIETPSQSRPWYRASYLGWLRIFPEEDVVWIRSPDPENPYGRGTGIAEALSDELDIDEFAAKHVKAWFYNRAMPDAIVSLEGLGDDEVKRLKEKFDSQFRGVEKAGQVHVTNAKLSVEVLSQTFKEQQLGELRQLQRDTVLQVFNVPPECLGIIENSNRATIGAADFLYAKGVLVPRLDFLASEQQPLVDLFDPSLLLDYVSPVPDDREFEQKVMVQVPAVFTIDEHRALAGKPPLPNGEGDVLYEPAAVPAFGAPPPEPAPEEPKPGDPPPDEPLPGEKAPLRALPSPRKDLPPGSQAALDALRADRLVHEVEPVWEAKMRKWGSRVLRELGVAPAFDMRNPLVRAHLEKFAAEKITGYVNETTRQEIRDALAEGATAGEGIEQIKRRIMDVFDRADRVRARMIARTEVVGSANFANVEAFRQSGVVAGKEWLAVGDNDTRDTHLELDGQVVGLGDSFEANGKRADHPGDFGDPAEDINCRCSVLPKVEGKAVSERAAIWKTFDRRATSWELEAARALRRGFRAQEQDVLAAFGAGARSAA